MHVSERSSGCRQNQGAVKLLPRPKDVCWRLSQSCYVIFLGILESGRYAEARCFVPGQLVQPDRRLQLLRRFAKGARPPEEKTNINKMSIVKNWDCLC